MLNINGDYCHPCVPEEMQIRKFKQAVKICAVNETTPIPQIYGEEATRIDRSTLSIASLLSQREISQFTVRCKFKNPHFQQFIIEKNERDKKIIKELDNIKSSNSSMEADLLLLNEKYQDVDKSMKAQDVMFKQFLFLMLDDILKFIGEMNVGAGGRTLDADLKSNFERFRTQMSNAIAGKIVKDSNKMCDLAANFYEDLFHKSENIVRPHPYVDAPWIDFDNKDDPIPLVSLDELLLTINDIKKKKSIDAHGLNNYMFNFLHSSHWSFLLHLYNLTFSSSFLPSSWKDTRILLLAKNNSVCLPAQTRPISLLDCFQKVGGKLFLTRFRDILCRRGLLPTNQFGFMDKFRLQTRLLLFLEDIYSCLSNSSPTATIFVDFKCAFDMLWHDGYIGNFRQMGIPMSFIKWIKAWFENRR
ncbi:unnamed protein product [Rotaria magnacalcarata]